MSKLDGSDASVLLNEAQVVRDSSENAWEDSGATADTERGGAQQVKSTALLVLQWSATVTVADLQNEMDSVERQIE